MTQVVEAIYTDGTLRPLDPLQLEEQQLVRVTIEVIEGTSMSNRSEAIKRLLERLDRSTFTSSGKLPNRDELHER